MSTTMIRSTPIVPRVLIIGDRQHPYRLPELERYATQYATPTTVRLFGRANVMQQHCYCLPSEASWQTTQTMYAAFQAGLTALADELRRLGRYPERLAEAGGIKAHPESLTATVISCDDPSRHASFWWGQSQNHGVPHCVRVPVERHTSKMLGLSVGGLHSQYDYTVCPDDAAFEDVARLEEAARRAAVTWEVHLDRLGTYATAVADGRYAPLLYAIQPSLFG
ncbi:MAG: hypothetical protein H0X37_19840 [Herpetosiphonaceae bacterium]|nr:hypothetical protein [Herpetosiphonaceae bacterium]